MKFKDIPQMTQTPAYKTNVSWSSLEHTLERYNERGIEGYNGLELNPDFQRGHVWSEEQQIAYCEFRLRGGKSGNEILFNHPNWQGTYKGDMVLVDGLQRITAVRRFLNNEIQTFGYYYDQFTDRLPWDVDFVFYVNNLKTRKAVLRWYLELNSGGTPHSQEELDRVMQLMKSETK